MKFKLFYFGGSSGWTADAERVINEWMKKNPAITILQHQIAWSPGGNITLTFVYA